MFRSVFSLVCLVVPVVFAACEKTVEQKKEEILENKLENSANIKDIKADSLKERAKELENSARMLEKEADNLRDSARKN